MLTDIDKTTKATTRTLTKHKAIFENFNKVNRNEKKTTPVYNI